MEALNKNIDIENEVEKNLFTGFIEGMDNMLDECLHSQEKPEDRVEELKAICETMNIVKKNYHILKFGIEHMVNFLSISFNAEIAIWAIEEREALKKDIGHYIF